ncbi:MULTISPECIES: pyridoxamine 5'-phosphate oxidase family protein [unclassified Brevundimonas]|uniref:pyridoxamine 5'-phosphate oxidase family protein n=1 Tax=unclassified Brevundimonas TaxID=2622653 RepID=UPI0025C0349D|nr:MULTISPECIES: pyridoxamine 5'-phosphate oxidase family protein [unclassified Brevundimonas]
MSDKELTVAEAQEAFWKALKSSNTGMLGLDRPGYLSQPMTAFQEENSSTIWFFTRDDVELARDVAGGADARFEYGSKDQKVWASLRGRLTVAPRDQAIIDRHWNPVVAAWYPEGKEDPHLALLRFDGADGRIWVSDGGLLKFAFEIVKANVTGETPDSGGAVNVNL